MDSVKSGTPRPIQSPSLDSTQKPRAAATPVPSETAPETSQGAPPWWPSGPETEAGAKPGWGPQVKPTTTTDSAPQDSDPRDKYSMPSMPFKGNDAQLAMAKLVRTRVTKNGLSRVSAGAYAERRGSTAGRYGTASYEASAKAEARAEISADSKLSLNGLNANAKAYAGLSAEASLTGALVTKPYNLAGVSMTAGVEASGKLSATAGLGASGRVQVTSSPPTAIVQGSASASAVAKVKGTITGRLGPVGITANSYLSAGAEAKTSGIAGYQDGTLKLGASAGASAGVGAGCGLLVDVDCSGKPAGKPASSKPASSKPASSKPASGKPASGKPASGKPASGKPASGKPASSKPASSKPASSKPASDKPASDKPAGAPRRREKTPRAREHVHGGAPVGASATGTEKPGATSWGG